MLHRSIYSIFMNNFCMRTKPTIKIFFVPPLGNSPGENKMEKFDAL